MPNPSITLALLVGFLVAWMPLSGVAQESENGSKNGTVERPQEVLSPKIEAPGLGDGMSEQVLALRREELQRVVAKLEAKESQTRALMEQLAVVDGRIEELKSGATSPRKSPSKASPSQRLSGGGTNQDDLEELLRESQRLSEYLAHRAAEVHALDVEVASYRERFAVALDREIGRLHASWNGADPTVLRHQLVPKLRALHQERRALSVAKGQGRGGPHEFSNPDIRGTDDPDALLEMANLYLDREDRLRKEIKAVESHIQRLLDEQELEARLAALVYEESLFDETEREVSPTQTVAHETAGGFIIGSASREAASGVPMDIPNAVGVASGNNNRSEGNTSPQNPPGAGEATRSGQEESASALPNVEEDRPMTFPGGNWGESNSVEALRQYVRELRAKADEFHQKANEATRRTRDML